MTRANDLSRLWADLKRELRRQYGPRGSADWLAFAAEQEALHADRAERNVIDLKPAGWTP